MAILLAGVLLLAACENADEPLPQPAPMAEKNPIEYPVSMWDRRVEGETMLLVHVDEYGDVDSLYVERSSGQPAFDSAALAGAKRLRFTPGRRGEKHIAMWTRLPVRFAMDSTATLGVTVSPEPRMP
jgi:TonB family protein